MVSYNGHAYHNIRADKDMFTYFIIGLVMRLICTIGKKSFNIDKHIFWKLLHASVPEFIIFGGTFGYVWNDLRKEYGDYFYPIRFTKELELNEFPEKQFSVWKMENRPFPVLIQTYHPSCPENVFAIIPRAINEIKEGSYILEKYEVTQGD